MADYQRSRIASRSDPRGRRMPPQEGFVPPVLALRGNLVARCAVPESRDPIRPRRSHVAGAVLVPFVFAATEGSSWGWVSIPTLM